MKKKIIAIIPARGGSKRIPLKNIVDFCGKPLIALTINTAKESEIFDKIVVSTDHKKIAEISEQYSAQVIKRPKELSGDKIKSEEVILHVLNSLKQNEDYKPDVIFLLEPPFPLRTKQDILNSYSKFQNDKLDSLLTVVKNTYFIWEQKGDKFRPINYNYKNRPMTQDVNQFREQAVVYITKYNIFMKHKNRLGGKIGYYLLDESVDIDTPTDLLVAEQMFKRRENAKQ